MEESHAARAATSTPVDSLSTAVARYRKRDPQHRNVARSLNNMAYVKRLIALQLRRRIDADAARRRKAATRGRTQHDGSKVSYRSRFEQLRQEALNELGEAATIYEQYGNHHGLGSVHLNYGFLHLDNGDMEHAEAQGKIAFRLGEERCDHILMARARLLQCMIENARVEEGIGESTEPGSHARIAQDCAQEAIELAKHTENRRLLAHAHIWQGGRPAIDSWTTSNRRDAATTRPPHSRKVTTPRARRTENTTNAEVPRLARRQGEPHAARLVARLGRR